MVNDFSKNPSHDLNEGATLAMTNTHIYVFEVTKKFNAESNLQLSQALY